MMRKVVPIAMRLTGIALAVAASAFATFSEMKNETDKNPRVMQQEGFTVVGIAVRTSNAEQMTAERPIGKQWERLFKDGVVAAIPNKADGNIVALYTEYASDKDGEYTYVLGARVTKVESLPAGMVAKNVPGGRMRYSLRKEVRYKRLSSKCGNEFGPRRRVSWAEIERTEADFEMYDQRAQNPADSEVDLYIGIR